MAFPFHLTPVTLTPSTPFVPLICACKFGTTAESNPTECELFCHTQIHLTLRNNNVYAVTTDLNAEAQAPGECEWLGKLARHDTLTNAPKRARTHAHTHARADGRTNTRTHAWAHVCAFVHACVDAGGWRGSLDPQKAARASMAASVKRLYGREQWVYALTVPEAKGFGKAKAPFKAPGQYLDCTVNTSFI